MANSLSHFACGGPHSIQSIYATRCSWCHPMAWRRFSGPRKQSIWTRRSNHAWARVKIGRVGIERSSKPVIQFMSHKLWTNEPWKMNLPCSPIHESQAMNSPCALIHEPRIMNSPCAPIHEPQQSPLVACFSVTLLTGRTAGTFLCRSPDPSVPWHRIWNQELLFDLIKQYKQTDGCNFIYTT